MDVWVCSNKMVKSRVYEGKWTWPGWMWTVDMDKDAGVQCEVNMQQLYFFPIQSRKEPNK